MSRIEDLIATHCPDGVPFRSVGEAALVVRMPGQVKREDFARGSTFPIVDQSVDFIAGYTDDPSLVVSLQPYVVFGDHTRAVKYVDFAFAQGADGIKVLQAADGLSTRWLYYCLAHFDIPSRGYNRHWTVVRDLRIPVPPPPVQAEIMRVLDAFVSLQTELESELELRSRQYAFYRDSLLAFADRGTVRWATLSEVGSLYNGLTGKAKADFQDGNARFVTYMNVFKNLATDTTPDTLVKVGTQERQNEVRYGDVLFTASSESAEEVGMASGVTVEPPGRLYLNSFCFGFRPNDPSELHPEFSKHLFRSAAIRRQIIKTASGVTRINISKERFRKVEIPIPAPAEQVRLASLLDRFEALTNDLSVGLPAEIRARQAQYESYRDRLLTFEELAS